jgi:DsbC/DsbD-like thiol-disulfide interchange protein
MNGQKPLPLSLSGHKINYKDTKKTLIIFVSLWFSPPDATYTLYQESKRDSFNFLGDFQVMKLARTLFFIALTLGVFAAGALAQDPSKAVSAKGVVSVDKVRQGRSFQVAVLLDIGQNFHINSYQPKDPNLIPTKIEPVKADGIVFGPLTYPKGEEQKFKFSDEPLSVYSGHVVIKFPARTTAKLPLGQQTLRAKVRYQACNDQACFPPKTIEVTIPVEVVAANAKVSSANEDVFGATRSAKPKGK